jgi:hypothetical protein
MNKSLLAIENIKHEDINHSNFESIKVYSDKIYSDDEHLKRKLMRYTPTGELYFYGFNENIDYANSNDPQHRTYIPVKSEEEADKINLLDVFHILTLSPRLVDDWHADGTRVTKWIK